MGMSMLLVLALALAVHVSVCGTTSDLIISSEAAMCLW